MIDPVIWGFVMFGLVILWCRCCGICVWLVIGIGGAVILCLKFGGGIWGGGNCIWLPPITIDWCGIGSIILDDEFIGGSITLETCWCAVDPIITGTWELRTYLWFTTLPGIRLIWLVIKWSPAWDWVSCRRVYLKALLERILAIWKQVLNSPSLSNPTLTALGRPGANGSKENEYLDRFGWTLRKCWWKSYIFVDVRIKAGRQSKVMV